VNALALGGADPLVLERHVAVVPLEQALCCLGRQPLLAAPAKLALCGHGDATLFAEVSRGLDTHAALACAEAAALRARLWLAGGTGESPSPATRDALEEALCELDWSFERRPEGWFRASVSPAASPAQLQVEALCGDQIRVWQDALLPLRTADPHVLARFALEANRALRHARLSIVPAEPGHVRAVWDAVMPALPDVSAALEEAVAAVQCARGETWHGLRALRSPSVQHAFERLRALRP
jgi:hypothetical protein